MNDESKELKGTITFSESASKHVFDMLDVKGKECQICNKKLTAKNWAGFIYGKPICNDTMCLMDVVFEHHRKEKK